MIMTYDEQLRFILDTIKKFDKKKWKFGVLFYFDLIELEESGADVDIIKENIGSDVDKIILGVVPVSINIVSEEQIDYFYKILKDRMGYFAYASEYEILEIDKIINIIESELEDIEND